MTSAKSKFAAASVAVAATLLLSEIAVRIFCPGIASGVRVFRTIESERGKFCRYSATLGWEGTPLANDDFEWVDARCHVEQNRYGFRGREFGHGRDERRRLLVLGDSFVWGFGVNEPDLFTEIINRRSRPPIEAINMGVSGYGTDQEFLLWQAAGRQWSPDDVVLVVTPFTDVYDNLSPERYYRQKPVFRFAPGTAPVLLNVPVPRLDSKEDLKTSNKTRASGLLPFLLEHSDLACLVVAVLSRNDDIRKSLEEDGVMPERRAGYDWEYHFFQSPYDDAHQQAWNVLAAIVGLLNADVKKAGARLTIVIVPSVVQVYPDLWARFKASAGIPPGTPLDDQAPNHAMTRIASEQGIPVIDLLPDFRDAAQRNASLFFPVNCHWTRSGHQLVADVLLRAFSGRIAKPTHS